MDKEAFRRRYKVFIRDNRWFRVGSILSFAFLLFLPCHAFANWSPLIERLVADGFDESEIRDLFSRQEVRFEPGAMSAKLEELLKKPVGTKRIWVPSSNPRTVYVAYLRPKPMTLARSYLRENASLLESISRGYGVPKEIIVSILLLETHLGAFVGKKWAFNSLASMALCTELEAIRSFLPKKLVNPRNEAYARSICWEKAHWAYTELKSLLLYAGRNGFDPLSFPGSVYGAIGLCQFMPSSCLFYAVDGDEDGRVDLFTKSDALSSIANYLRDHGWHGKMDKAGQLRVVLDYNKSWIYANTVLAVAERLHINYRPNR